MRKMSVLFGLVVFTLFTGSITFAQGHAKPMSNDDVVTMVKAGLPDATVINAIHAQETNFDDSASALVNLKKQGVSSKIMDAMLAAPSKHRDSAATPPASGTQNSASPAAGQPQAGTAAPAHHSGFFGRLRQVQDQVNGSMQQAQGAVQQAQGTVQGTVQQAQGTAQQVKGTVQSPLGQQSSVPAQTVAPATGPATPDAATVQANVLQAQQVPITKQNAIAQQQRRQPIADRREQAKKRLACRQQAAKAHPEGGTDLVNAYMACTQTNVKLQAR